MLIGLGYSKIPATLIELGYRSYCIDIHNIHFWNHNYTKQLIYQSLMCPLFRV